MMFFHVKQKRWSCWTRGGSDFVYRRIVSYVRQSLTVAVCLDDDEVAALSSSFPALSICPSIRLEAWSAQSMQLAAGRSLSAGHSGPLRTANVNMARTSKQIGRQEGGTSASKGAWFPSNNVNGQREEWLNSRSKLSGKGHLSLWAGATHVHLVGVLAFGRFQSTVSAFKDLASSLPEGSGEMALEALKRDAHIVTEESERLFDAWMAQVSPSCCIEVFKAVEACAGGKGDSSEKRGQDWGALRARCFRVMAEEGRGPRPASVDEVLLLFKHLCRLGCRRRVHSFRVSWR